MEQLKKLSLYTFMGLLAYMPLHIFLSTWLGTSFGILDSAKVAKDVILPFGFLLALFASYRLPWFKEVVKDKLVWLIAAYAFLTIVLTQIRPNDQDAEILGVVFNLRFLLFFLYGYLLSKLFDKKPLLKLAAKTTLAAAALVIIFGVVQYTLLPNNALTHVGYSRPNGVLPAFFIDDKPDLERVMSTLRDPNSFGSYLIIILALVSVFLIIKKDKNVRQILLGILFLSLLCLWFTYSRSAWIGGAITLLCVGLLRLKYLQQIKIKKPLLLLGAITLLLLPLSTFVFRNTYFVKNVVFHADEQTVLENPNELRLRLWQESMVAVALEPVGFGPGSAGLASIKNDTQGTVLNENYYLQILYEVGVTGLVLFLSILILVAIRLYKLSQNSPYALALLAAFAGLAITNFLVHIWSNEAVAYTWWGLAGLVYANKFQKVK